MKQLLAVLFLLMFLSCSEKRSTDAEECYRLWSGTKPPKEVKLLNGSYWESPHFTKEYIMFLELEATDEWRKLMKENNKFVPAENDWEKPLMLLFGLLLQAPYRNGREKTITQNHDILRILLPRSFISMKLNFKNEIYIK